MLTLNINTDSPSHTRQQKIKYDQTNADSELDFKQEYCLPARGEQASGGKTNLAECSRVGVYAGSANSRGAALPNTSTQFTNNTRIPRQTSLLQWVVVVVEEGEGAWHGCHGIKVAQTPASTNFAATLTNAAPPLKTERDEK